MNLMINLYNDDCLNVLPTLSDKSVDLIITSPPYNIGRSYNKYNDNRKDYVSWLIKIFNDCCRILKTDGHLFLNLSSTKNYPFACYKIAEQLDWQLQNNIIWAKSIEIDGYVRGYSTPTSSKRYLQNGWEHIFHFTKNGNTEIDLEWSGVPYNTDYNNAVRNEKRSGKSWRTTTTCWYYTYKSKATKEINRQITGDKLHPAIYPNSLVEKCIKVSGLKKGIVLDPFMGTGTTGLVAKKYNLNFTGIEIDQDYFEFAKQRINATY
tara:strand:+ start:855 stop:1646 length:792 start_codon:yes stop_codon:yes gene_type:complete